MPVQGGPTRRTSRGGFTLVELLVVIGIIALLIGILMPVLSKAREQARAVVCSNNQRQILLAMMMYANENQGILPIPWVGVGGQGHAPYVAIWTDSGPGCLYRWQDGEGTLWPYVGTKDPGARERLFDCPDDTEPRVIVNHTIGEDSNGAVRNFSYVFNADLYTAFGGTIAGTSATIGVRLPRVTGSEHKILIAESTVALCGGFNFLLYMDIPMNPLLPPRHSGRAFVGMADGHVELFEPADLLNPMKGPTLFVGEKIPPQYLYYCQLH